MYMCDYCKNIPVSRTIEWIVEEWWFVWPMHRTRMYDIVCKECCEKRSKKQDLFVKLITDGKDTTAP